jgi:hypothetical protein
MSKPNSQICKHGIQKYSCRECGTGHCTHGTRKTLCPECGGGSLCPHQIAKSKCTKCGGTSVCPHGRQRYNCKETECRQKGRSIVCPHGMNRKCCKEQECMQAGYTSICHHNVNKYSCRYCKRERETSETCKHRKPWDQCQNPKCVAEADGNRAKRARVESEKPVSESGSSGSAPPLGHAQKDD